DGVVKLVGEDNLYRIRVGNYRIIYSIQDNQLLILVLKIGHRRDVYQ
ncbi:MAG: type II toxin-antitoxin system RelE family toxin, partial [Pseudanabaena sp.]